MEDKLSQVSKSFIIGLIHQKKLVKAAIRCIYQNFHQSQIRIATNLFDDQLKRNSYLNLVSQLIDQLYQNKILEIDTYYVFYGKRFFDNYQTCLAFVGNNERVMQHRYNHQQQVAKHQWQLMQEIMKIKELEMEQMHKEQVSLQFNQSKLMLNPSLDISCNQGIQYVIYDPSPLYQSQMRHKNNNINHDNNHLVLNAHAVSTTNTMLPYGNDLTNEKRNQDQTSRYNQQKIKYVKICFG